MNNPNFNKSNFNKLNFNKSDIYKSIFSGVIETTITHPIDYIKTMKQSNKSIYFKNIYNGYGSKLIGVVPMRMLFWTSKEYFQKKYYFDKYKNIKTGFMVAMFQTTIDFPVEQIKINKMIKNTRPSYSLGYLSLLSRNIIFASVAFSVLDFNNSIYSPFVAGFIASLTSHPFDTLKTHYQTKKTIDWNKIKFFSGVEQRCLISFLGIGIGYSVFNFL